MTRLRLLPKVRPPVTNYARHVGVYEREEIAGALLAELRTRRKEIVPATGEVVFFGDVTPSRLASAPLEQWAFYRVPQDIDARFFNGKIIGVDNA